MMLFLLFLFNFRYLVVLDENGGPAMPLSYPRVYSFHNLKQNIHEIEITILPRKKKETEVETEPTLQSFIELI